MKRSEIIGLLESAGQLMDMYDHVEIKNHDTDEALGTIPNGDIRGMQTALFFCKHLLDGTYEEKNPIELANKMLSYHGAVAFGLDQRGYCGSEYCRAGDAND